MKKFLALMLSLALISVIFASCKKAEVKDETDAQQQTQQSETQQSESTEKQTEKQTEPMTKDDSSKEQEVLKQAKKINEAQRFAIKFGFLDHDKDVYLSGKDSPYPKVEKYYLLKDYKSINDFKKTALSYYSKKEANDKFFKYSENEADWKISGGPFMIEKDSKVYADVMRFGISSELVYKADSVKVKSVEGNNAVITVDYYFAREPEIIEKKDFKMVKENGLWVFDEIVY